MSLYDDVILPDFGTNISTATSTNLTSNQSQSSANSSTNKTEPHNDIANWNTNSLKLLQYQVEVAKKRQMTLNSSAALKREKASTNIAPVIDLSDKNKPQLQLKKDTEYLTNSTNIQSNQTSELRFNSLTGKIEKEDTGSLYASLDEEYDPSKPNKYEKIVNEVRKKLNNNSNKNNDDEHEQRNNKKQRESERKSRRSGSSSSSERRDRDRDRDRKRRSSRDRDRDRKRQNRRTSSSSSDDDRRKDISSKSKRSDEPNVRSNFIAPPPSLIEADTKLSNESNDENNKPSVSTTAKSLTGGLLKAEKMMAKMGYKEGEGLGRNNQGMSIALQVEKTGKRSGRIIHEKDVVEEPIVQQPLPPPPPISPATTPVGIPNEVMKNMSKVILLRNMVQPGEVDDDLEAETKEECQKYGEVNKCYIFEMPNRPKDEAVRIFIEFKTLPSAIKALTDLNGRFFGGRVVKATFYNFDKFKRLELADDV